MKLILSRKGFDSGYGGIPSVILPSKELVSFPIPDNSSNISYSDIVTQKGGNIANIINDLSGGIVKYDNKKIKVSEVNCHLDPDICESSKIREESWRGILGQSGAAQTHLENMNVTEGDIFLFFGWFRDTEIIDGRLRYLKNSDKHIIFGFLEIDEILKVNKLEPRNWQKDHVHVLRGKDAKDNDTVYIGKKVSQFNEEMCGYGTFGYSEKRVLTKKGYSKSKWELPPFFKDTKISYHSDISWKDEYFQSAAKGQEFVVDVTPDIHMWISEILL